MTEDETLTVQDYAIKIQKNSINLSSIRKIGLVGKFDKKNKILGEQITIAKNFVEKINEAANKKLIDEIQADKIFLDQKHSKIDKNLTL